MSQTEMFEDMRLSYSSANLLRNCEQKFVHYKVNKVEKDSDQERDDSHFHIGTAFHFVLEMSMHKKPENIGKLLEQCVQEIGLKEEDIGLVHALVIQYLRLRKLGDFEAVVCEHKIDDENVIGYIDLVEARPNGDWCISDLKTAATFYENKVAELARDRQLNLYGSYYKEIAKAYNLDPDKFIGCRYLVTSKSKAKQQKKETYDQYVMRMVEKKLVRSYAVFIPKELLTLDEVKSEHLELHKKSMSLRQGEVPKKNFTYCMAYFRPCDFWSKCHGESFSKLDPSIIVQAIK
tara:strand:- start:179 stop:1051 length:873 start_codon:yes stop_codon:yes gene_type:complete